MSASLCTVDGHTKRSESVPSGETLEMSNQARGHFYFLSIRLLTCKRKKLYSFLVAFRNNMLISELLKVDLSPLNSSRQAI